MKIYAIGDLHLSFSDFPDPPRWQAREYKPMSEVDSSWDGHARKIYENWTAQVRPGDLVLLPGDISWAMRLEDTGPDFHYLGLLPGRIAAVKGNHDYWWQGISRARKAMPANASLIQNDCLQLGEVTAVCGTRGWTCPGSSIFTEKDMPIYRRELIRMENSLRCARNAGQIIVIMHFMPTNEKHEESGFIDLFREYGVSTVVYGHLHARACRHRLPENAWGIRFQLASADFLDFAPKRLF